MAWGSICVARRATAVCDIAREDVEGARRLLTTRDTRRDAVRRGEARSRTTGSAEAGSTLENDCRSTAGARSLRAALPVVAAGLRVFHSHHRHVQHARVFSVPHQVRLSEDRSSSAKGLVWLYIRQCDRKNGLRRADHPGDTRPWPLPRVLRQSHADG